jgi:tyrosine-protein kinase Etk/Wzc
MGLDDLVRLVRRQWRVIAATFAVVVTGTAVYTWTAKPVWEASALIRVEEQGANAVEALLLPGMVGSSDLETEMLVAATHPVLSVVAVSLKNHFELRDPPDVPRHALFSHVDFDRTTSEADYEIVRLEPDRYRLRTVGRAGLPLELEFQAGDTVALPGGSFALLTEGEMLQAGAGGVPKRMEVGTLEFEHAVSYLQEDLSVSRPDRMASLFRVAYQGKERWLVRTLVNDVAQAFIEQRGDIQKAKARSTVDLLREQTAGIHDSLEARENELRSFRERNQVVALGAEAEEQVRSLADLRTERTRYATERDALANRLEEALGSGHGTPDYRKLMAFPTFLRNPTFQDLVRALMDAEARRTELLGRATESHPDVILVNKQIADLEDQVVDLATGYLNSLSDQIATVDTALVRLGVDLEEIPARELEFARLEREIDGLAGLYAVLQEGLKEAEVTAAVDDQSVHVVEPAVMSREPVKPRKAMNMAVASVLGLMLGLGLALVRQAVDHRLRADDDVGKMLGAPVLTRVPRLPAAAANGPRPATLVAQHQGTFVSAEAYRSLRSSIFFASLGGDGHKELVVTSPGPRDGKSVTASNLAVTFAQQGLQTLLIDADLRRSTLHQAFEVEQSPGLTEYLRDEVSLDRILAVTDVPRLFLLPAGEAPPNPSELLGGKKMEDMLELVRDYFDAIVVDSPPVLAVTDPVVLAHKVGGVLLVVRTGQTHREAADEALHQLRMVGANVLGVVVNESERRGRYGYGGAYYGAYH